MAAFPAPAPVHEAITVRRRHFMLSLAAGTVGALSACSAGRDTALPTAGAAGAEASACSAEVAESAAGGAIMLEAEASSA